MSELRSQPEVNRAGAPSSLDQALGLIEELQASLDSLRGQLARSNRLSTLGTLAAGLAHETNNLLTPVGTYAQLALADPDNTALQHKALRIAVEGVAQAGRLAESMLGFAQPADEAAAPSCKAEKTIRSTAQWMLPLLERDRISLEIQAEDADAAIDPLALRQVVMNLISNARNALRRQAGPRRIRLRARREGDRVLIDCADNGPGVPEALRGRLFEPFVSQAVGLAGEDGADAPGRHDGPPGSGLGLSICRDLVGSAGGAICLSQSPLGGAGFTIDLPAGG